MKKKAIKILTSFCTVTILIFLSVIGICAQDVESDFSDNAEAIYLYSCNANRVLYCMGEEKSLPVGPTAKIMTGLIACEMFGDNLDKKIALTSTMLDNVTGNSMGLKVGMSVTVRDLIYGTVCGGNNDAAQALAIVCAGSTSAFLDKMNSRADMLYMKSTEYSNPTGLDNTPSKTTLSDISKLVIAATQNDLYMEISSSASYQTSVEEITVYNRNALISQFSAQGYINKNAKGIIAGSTESGGFSLATLAQKGDLTYICIIMGATADENEIYSYSIANELLDTYFNKYSFKKVLSVGQSLGALNVTHAMSDKNGAKVAYEISEDVYALLPKDTDITRDLTYKPYLYEKELVAPVEKGMCVGGLDIYHGSVLVAKAKLVTQTSVEENKLLSFLDEMKAFFTGRFFIVFIIISVPSLAIYLYFDSINSRHKKVSTIRYKKFY